MCVRSECKEKRSILAKNMDGEGFTVYFLCRNVINRSLVEMDAEKIAVGILISVCVHCLLAQTFPYVSFGGQTLANHSYVDLSLVGHDDSGSDSVQCHTDLSTCCSGAQGFHRGDWYFPNGTRLPLFGAGDIYETRGAQRVNILSRHTSNEEGASGLYRCDIATGVLGVEPVPISIQESVYVGLYLSGGEFCWQHQPPSNFGV